MKTFNDEIVSYSPEFDLSNKYYDEKLFDILDQNEKKHFWFNIRKEKIIKLFRENINRDSSILEIGPGTGYIADELKKIGYSLDLADIHSTSLLYARQKGFKKLFQFNLESSPFKEKYDVIALFDVLEHLQNDVLGLNNIYSMLKPEGYIIMTVPAHQWLWNKDDMLSGHKRRYNKKELIHKLTSSNFEIVEIKYFFIFILPFLFLRKLIPYTAKKSHCGMKINPFLNALFLSLSKLENKISKFIPNIAGGSLIVIGKRK